MNLPYVSDAIARVAPVIGIVLFALPSFVGIVRQRKFIGLVIFVVLGVFALAIETFALKTGLPYGDFSYTDTLGSKLFDTTPWAVALAYPPVLLSSFWFASKFTRSFGRVVITAILATLVDVVLDPATVTLQFWSWETPGPFYGIPIMSFIGWLVSALLGGLLLHILWGKEQRVKAPVAYSGLAILLFWTGVNAGVQQYIPLGIGAVYSLVIVAVLILEKQQFKESA